MKMLMPHYILFRIFDLTILSDNDIVFFGIYLIGITTVLAHTRNLKQASLHFLCPRTAHQDSMALRVPLWTCCFGQ